jgi:hypothetical protein
VPGFIQLLKPPSTFVEGGFSSFGKPLV